MTTTRLTDLLSELGRHLNACRNRALSPARRQEIARRAARARWDKVARRAGRRTRKPLLEIAALVILAMLPAGQVGAHPGRLGVDGCHTVGQGGYVYKSGKVAKPGSRHCHRLATGQPAILDGTEHLAGDDETPCDKRQRAALERAEQGLDPNADAALVGAARQIVQDALASCP